MLHGAHGQRMNMAQTQTDAAPVLIIDDEASVRDLVAQMLSARGFVVESAENGKTAIDMANGKEYAVAIVDMTMPGMSGMETIRHLKKSHPEMECVIFTGYPSIDDSIEAIQEQVFDYICKPVSADSLARVVRRAAERRELVLSNRRLAEALDKERNQMRERLTSAAPLPPAPSGHPAFSLLVGFSESLDQVKRFITEVAPSDMTVLLRGESGTGKDVVARLIHELSGRDANSFVKINCPAIPEALLESELFGHEQGAFTGAERAKPGRLEMAANGTVFLDEIGEIAMSVQAKLLQAIEHKQFTRLGGSKTIQISARIIAATNAPLEQMMREGRFRVDLFYRLNHFHINLPPLRKRSEDIPVLTQHFLKVYGRKYDREGLRLSPEAMSAMINRDWPGNIRELESVISRYALSGDESVIFQSATGFTVAPAPDQVDNSLQDSEVRTIMSALVKSRWNRRQAAKMLGISYSSLRRRIDKYGLDKDASTPLT